MISIVFVLEHVQYAHDMHQTTIPYAIPPMLIPQLAKSVLRSPDPSHTPQMLLFGLDRHCCPTYFVATHA